jgi:hypothetical protein
MLPNPSLRNWPANAPFRAWLAPGRVPGGWTGQAVPAPLCHQLAPASQLHSLTEKRPRGANIRPETNQVHHTPLLVASQRASRRSVTGGCTASCRAGAASHPEHPQHTAHAAAASGTGTQSAHSCRRRRRPRASAARAAGERTRHAARVDGDDQRRGEADGGGRRGGGAGTVPIRTVLLLVCVPRCSMTGNRDITARRCGGRESFCSGYIRSTCCRCRRGQLDLFAHRLVCHLQSGERAGSAGCDDTVKRSEQVAVGTFGENNSTATVRRVHLTRCGWLGAVQAAKQRAVAAAAAAEAAAARATAAATRATNAATAATPTDAAAAAAVRVPDAPPAIVREPEPALVRVASAPRTQVRF